MATWRCFWLSLAYIGLYRHYIRFRGFAYRRYLGFYRDFTGFSGFIGNMTIQGLGLPKVRGTILEVPLRRIIVYWGPLILGNCHIGFRDLGPIVRVSFEDSGLEGLGFRVLRKKTKMGMRQLVKVTVPNGQSQARFCLGTTEFSICEWEELPKQTRGS